MHKQTLTDNLLNEVILYGGLPYKRVDVYRHALETTDSRKAADMFAFSKKAIDMTPMDASTLYED